MGSAASAGLLGLLGLACNACLTALVPARMADRVMVESARWKVRLKNRFFARLTMVPYAKKMTAQGGHFLLT